MTIVIVLGSGTVETAVTRTLSNNVSLIVELDPGGI